MDIHKILEIKKHQIKDSNEIHKSRNQKKHQIILSLDQRNFDDVLGGGFYSGKKYVIFGPNKAGKTQLCHQLCVQAYKHLNKIFKLKKTKFVYYFDTENTFRPERIEELVAPTEFEIDRVLKSVLISKIMSSSALLLALKDFEKFIIKDMGGILIIDTINNHFRSDLSNNNIMFQKAKNRFLNILKIIDEFTNKYNLITILTAQIASNFSRDTIIRELPVGNQFLNQFFSEYLYLSKENKEKNYVHLVNSLNHSEKKALYNITRNGIQDYKI